MMRGRNGGEKIVVRRALLPVGLAVRGSSARPAFATRFESHILTLAMFLSLAADVVCAREYAPRVIGPQ